jgi:hypothetical protein
MPFVQARDRNDKRGEELSGEERTALARLVACVVYRDGETPVPTDWTIAGRAFFAHAIATALHCESGAFT